MGRTTIKAALIGALSFGTSALVAYGVAMVVLPSVSAAPDALHHETNLQTTEVLAYNGGSLSGEATPLPNMIVVSENAIQADLGIADFNEGGFVADAPEINQSNPEKAAKHETFTHIVSPGETLSGIASRYGISTETLLWANDLNEKSTLRAGIELVVLPTDGVLHEVTSGDTLSGIAAKYEASSVEIAEYNRLDPSKLSVGMKLIVPGGKTQVAAPRILAAGSVSSSSKRVTAGQVSGGLQMPVTGIITQGYGNTSFANRSGYYQGNHHGGVDIGAPYGTPVSAAHDGTVVFAGVKNGYGKVVFIKGKTTTGETVFTRYGHLQAYNVSLNQVVKAGQQIGEVGSTGRSTGPHLHFEIRNSRGEQYTNHPFYQANLNY